MKTFSFCVSLCLSIAGVCVQSCEKRPGKGVHMTHESAMNGNTIGSLYAEVNDPADTLFFSQLQQGIANEERTGSSREEMMNCEDYIVLDEFIKLNLVLENGTPPDNEEQIRQKVLTAYKCYANAFQERSGLSPGIITFPTRITPGCFTDSTVKVALFRTDGEYINEIKL